MHDKTDEQLLTIAEASESRSLELMAKAEACLAEIRRRQNTEKIPMGITSPLLQACAVINAMGVTDKNVIRLVLTEALKPKAMEE